MANHCLHPVPVCRIHFYRFLIADMTSSSVALTGSIVALITPMLEDGSVDYPALRKLIIQSARENEVPVELVQRIIVRESTHRPGARNGPYYGLMQILPATARGMGYQGSPQGLLDAETNLKYAVKYLRGAYMVADGNQDAAVKWYSRGYYYEAKKKGLLQATGLR